MAPRRSRLPKVWIWSSIGLVSTVVLALIWWQQQLPARLQQAVRNDDLALCLQLAPQLAALRELSPQEHAQVATCLGRQAQRNWAQKRWWAALDQQRSLVRRSANPAAAERRLQQWREQIRQEALALYDQGKARAALDLLKASGESRFPKGQQLRASLQDNWAANRYAFAQASRSAARQQWWEALDWLNQLDHTWWKQHATHLRTNVENGAAALHQADHPKDSHGAHQDHDVPDALLDAAVKRWLEQGMSDWQAFEQACRDLGGDVVEEGPDSSCRR